VPQVSEQCSPTRASEITIGSLERGFEKAHSLDKRIVLCGLPETRNVSLERAAACKSGADSRVDGIANLLSGNADVKLSCPHRIPLRAN
jgi:hypothetical protein